MKIRYAVMVCAFVVFAACARQPEAGQPVTSDTASQTQNQQAVSISDFVFDPAQTTVKAGATVTWTNNDTAPHKVVEEGDRPGFSSENMSRGGTYSVTFDTPGTFNYYCQIHPAMKGTIVVTP